ncbi:hypothetical protein H0H81_011793 [Sphagnurus paluster]|uniref:Uncharacterized protein n=1 Tax=Sphagnurus paluster TaxID=117069 RepID=A0A9P7FUW5_9AGAR|nr:hypothetical protein H0H81_011793 [Sphagnurus paluster]
MLASRDCSGSHLYSRRPLSSILKKQLLHARRFLTGNEPTFNEQSQISHPGRHVHIRFFQSLNDFRKDFHNPALEAILPLGKDGGFDLERVKRLWGLETCAVIDPMRWELFKPGHPDALSPLAVHTLSDFFESLNVIEPFVSPCTHQTRAARLQIREDTPSFEIAWARFEQNLRESKVAELYDKAQQNIRCVKWRFKQWSAELSPLQQSLIFMISLALFLLYSAMQKNKFHPEREPSVSAC